MGVQNDIKFGTDGWRGVMAWDFTFARVRKLAQALADFILSEMTAEKSSSYPVVVGYDTRFLSDKFASEIALILKSNKINVTLCEKPVPTPLISLLTAKRFKMGVIVTASHNPFQYNGVKIKFNGYSASKELTDKIESLIGKHSPMSDDTSPIKIKDFTDEYVGYIKSKFNVGAIKSKIKKPIALDYMFGTQAGKLEKILSSQKVIAINDAPDPMFKGINPEPIEKNLKNLIDTVRKNKTAGGFAFDCDGDRLTVIDEKGKIITPCQIFPVILKYLIEQKKLKGKIIQTVSMGYLGKKIAEKKGFDFEQIPVGFKHLSKKMSEEKILAAAEESGGFAWQKASVERDGLLTTLLMLEIMAKTGKKLSELVSEIESEYGKSVFIRRDFTLLKPIPEQGIFIKRLIKKLPKKISGVPIKEAMSVDGLKIILDNDHWVLIRPSGTEKYFRIYAESDTVSNTNSLMDYAIKLMSKYLDTSKK
ncbi:MAG TPA: hypothetical protein VMW66_04245 [Elusimicrobiales bacterium]|nr:hypothetical protein [Elusimicrobiales bacterium]